MERNSKVKTVTAKGKTFNQSADKRIEWCNATRSKLLESRTKFEDVVFSRLSRNKKKYAVRQQRLELDGHIFFADIYIDRWKIVIEIDGGYHLSAEKQKSDRLRDKLCSEQCIRVFRITNEEVANPETLAEFAKVINESELLSKNMRPLNESELRFISNPNFAANGINRRSPRVLEFSRSGCKDNSIKYLRKIKLIERDNQI